MDYCGEIFPEWVAVSKCNNDPELEDNFFFPGSDALEKSLASYCSNCPTRIECLEWAIANNEPHGVWGGTSTRERERIKRYLRNKTLSKLDTCETPQTGSQASKIVRRILEDYVNNELPNSRPKSRRPRKHKTETA